ncbi:MAG TPA: TIM barrel protein [Acidobacteriota bacterium]|jgi:sugar phosphate isomerase/epimerase|nr:TIM barrel protein [Acidobacteriota bacterium]
MKLTRRNFLTGSAGFVTAFTLSPSATPQPPNRGPRLGTVTYNIAKDWDVDTIIKNLTEVGMEGVELRTTHAHGVEITLTTEQRVTVKKRFESSPVRIAGLGTTCEYHAANPQVVRKNVEETKEWIKLAKDIGSPSVKVRPNGLRKDVPEEKTLEQIGKALKECAAFALDHGIRIQLEVHGPETSRVPRIRKILDYAGDPSSLWICWNSNQTDLLDGGLERNFNLVKNKIGQVHMRDLFLEEYPWRRLLQLLNNVNFQGYCFAEIPESKDPVRVLKYFRGMFRAYQDII